MLQAARHEANHTRGTPRPGTAPPPASRALPEGYTPPRTEATCSRGFFAAPLELTGELAALAQRE